jgi:hypothetical protein
MRPYDRRVSPSTSTAPFGMSMSTLENYQQPFVQCVGGHPERRGPLVTNSPTRQMIQGMTSCNYFSYGLRVVFHMVHFFSGLERVSDVENGHLFHVNERGHVTKSGQHATVVVNATGTFGAEVESSFIPSECCKLMSIRMSHRAYSMFTRLL